MEREKDRRAEVELERNVKAYEKEYGFIGCEKIRCRKLRCERSKPLKNNDQNHEKCRIIG